MQVRTGRRPRRDGHRAAMEKLDAPVRATIAAAVERIVPSDDGLPGAREAGTISYILERARDVGPEAIARLGETARLLDARASARVRGATFRDLGEHDRDTILSAFETEQSPLFDELLEATMEGFYGDPVHGGNRGGVGWQLIGFPGPTGGAGYGPPLGWYDAEEPDQWRGPGPERR